MLTGSCCCGAIEFSLSETPAMLATCHCTRCREAGASNFFVVKAETFRWTRGEEYVSRYEPEEGYRYSRAFCSHCGTSFGDAGSNQESFALSANALDDDPGLQNRFHEFVAEKPSWLPICDDAKRFETHPVKC
jgi:hypothetical protein